jgi:pyrroline-5-carboxylate reductase
MTKVGFVGGGKMAEAMIGSLIESKLLGADDVLVCDILKERRQLLKDRFGVTVYTDNASVLSRVPVVVLAVKPQVLDATCREIAPHVTADHLVISIAAGKRLDRIESLLPAARVIRVMPNLPAVVSQGMSAFCAGQRVTPADRATASRLLSSFGRVAELPETQFDIVTALSGSGPAFFACFVEAMVEAAERLGLGKTDATLMAEQTMLGTGALLLNRKLSPEDVIAAVSSAKGTTVAGMQVLSQPGLKEIVFRTLEAAANRSRELSQ